MRAHSYQQRFTKDGGDRVSVICSILGLPLLVPYHLLNQNQRLAFWWRTCVKVNNYRMRRLAMTLERTAKEPEVPALNTRFVSILNLETGVEVINFNFKI